MKIKAQFFLLSLYTVYTDTDIRTYIHIEREGERGRVKFTSTYWLFT